MPGIAGEAETMGASDGQTLNGWRGKKKRRGAKRQGGEKARGG